MSKAISPLIAAIIMIAFVIAVATLLSPWFSGFVKEQYMEVEKSSEGQVNCIFSSIDFDGNDIQYDLSGSQDWVNVIVDNTGTENLYNFEISLTVDGYTYVYEPTSDTQRTSSNPLVGGGRVILVTDITDDLTGTLETVRIVAKNCPSDAKKEVSL